MVDWISLSQTAGTGSVTITVSASSYSELLERSTSLIVSGNGASATVNLIQRFDSSFDLSPRQIVNIVEDATSELDYRWVTITSDCPWSVVSKPNWVTLSEMSGVSSTTVSVIAEDNTGDTRTGTILFQNDNGLQRTLTVHQSTYVPYSGQYLTFIMQEDGEIVYSKTYGAEDRLRNTTIEYSINNGPWTSITSSGTGVWNGSSFSVKSGDVVRFRGDNPTYTYDAGIGSVHIYQPIGHLASLSKYIICGNIMSLISSTNFTGLTSFTRECVFGGHGEGYFSGGKVTSAKNLVLPVQSLTNLCYQGLFHYCTELVIPPQLPATTLANNCYLSMFEECTSLTSAPALPATTLSDNCYSNMFSECTNLVTPPVLSATTLTLECYSGMFSACTSLTTAPALPADNLAEGCYDNMFCGCTGLTSAPALPALGLSKRCYTYMFSGCTSLTSAPELPAIILDVNSYMYMFKDCSNLNYIKCLADFISSSGSTYKWVEGVAQSGTFVKSPNMTGWPTGINGIPSGWTVVDAS